MVSPGALDSDGAGLRGGTSFHMMASHSKRTDVEISQGSRMVSDREHTVRGVKYGKEPLLWSVSSDMPPGFVTTYLELLIIKFQILSHACRLGISNIGAVEKSHKIQQKQSSDNAPV